MPLVNVNSNLATKTNYCAHYSTNADETVHPRIALIEGTFPDIGVAVRPDAGFGDLQPVGGGEQTEGGVIVAGIEILQARAVVVGSRPRRRWPGFDPRSHAGSVEDMGRASARRTDARRGIVVVVVKVVGECARGRLSRAASLDGTAFGAHGILCGSLDSGRLKAPEPGEAWRGIGGL